MCPKQIPYICLDCPKFFPGVHLEPKSVPYRLSLINDTVCTKCIIISLPKVIRIDLNFFCLKANVGDDSLAHRDNKAIILKPPQQPLLSALSLSPSTHTHSMVYKGQPIRDTFGL